MEDQADILQHRIEVAPVDGEVRQRAGKGIRGENNKQQEAEIDHAHHRQHARQRILRHAAAENRHQQRPAAEQQHPEQQRAFVRAPGRSDAVIHRQQRVGVGGDIADGKVVNHEGVHQYEERPGDAEEQTARKRTRQPHQTRILAHRAPQRIDAQQQRDAQRQAEQKTSNFWHHDWVLACSASACGLL